MDNRKIIYLDDAIDAVEESRHLNHHQDGKAASCHEYEHRHFIKILSELPSAQSEQRWIPCSKTVDIPDHEVLACDKRGEMIIGYLVYYGKQWICESETEILFNPVAWMEKPEPYTER